MSMATRIAVMNQGRIAQIGAPQLVYEAPASRFVADFLGAVNLFAGRVEAVEGACHRIASPDTGATLTVDRDKPLPLGSDVTVAVRPEKIMIGAAAAASAPNRIEGAIESVSYRGEASTYRVALPSGKLVRVTAPNVTHADGFAVGARVILSWRADAAMVLEE